MPDAQTDELLIAGAKSYPQALAAISEFRRRVVEVIQHALKPHLNEISEAMGTAAIPASAVKGRFRPAKLENEGIDGVNAEAGIRIDRAEAAGWKQYYQLNWEAGQFYYSASIRFKNAEIAIRAVEALRSVDNSIGIENGNELYLTRELTAEEMSQLGEIARKVNADWTEAWLRVGGLKRFQAKSAAQTK